MLEDLVPFLNDGQIVKINPHVARADPKIGISSILPHPMAGYGGGPKIVMPGVANFDFIRNHHMRYTIHPQARRGYAGESVLRESITSSISAVGFSLSSLTACTTSKGNQFGLWQETWRRHRQLRCALRNSATDSKKK